MIACLLISFNLIGYAQKKTSIGNEASLSSKTSDSLYMSSSIFWNKDSVVCLVNFSVFDTASHGYPLIYTEQITLSDDSIKIYDNIIREIKLLVNHDYNMPSKSDLARAYVIEKYRANLLQARIDDPRPRFSTVILLFVILGLVIDDIVLRRKIKK